MAHQLSFDRLALYDPGKEGVSLQITLLLDNSSVAIAAKLDTGSTYCIFQRHYGESLGLDIEAGLPVKVKTVTGAFTAFGHFVTMSVFDYKIDSLVYFAMDESFNRNVLGRHGFLDQFRIAIIDYEGKLFLSPYE